MFRMDEVGVLLHEVREACVRRGVKGIDEFARMFKVYDKDKNNQLDQKELEQGLRKYGVSLDSAKVSKLFNHLDEDKNGSIDFNEFLLKLRPPLSDRRLQLITDVFSKMSGRITERKLTSLHNEQNALTQSTDKILQLDEGDQKVTLEDFVSYYTTLSASIDSDEYFEEMVRKAWQV